MWGGLPEGYLGFDYVVTFAGAWTRYQSLAPTGLDSWTDASDGALPDTLLSAPCRRRTPSCLRRTPRPGLPSAPI